MKSLKTWKSRDIWFKDVPKPQRVFVPFWLFDIDTTINWSAKVRHRRETWVRSSDTLLAFDVLTLTLNAVVQKESAEEPVVSVSSMPFQPSHCY